MNRLNIQKNMMKLMKPAELVKALDDTVLDLQKNGLTSQVKEKIIVVHFTAILSYQNKNLTFREYCDIVNGLMCYLND